MVYPITIECASLPRLLAMYIVHLADESVGEIDLLDQLLEH